MPNECSVTIKGHAGGDALKETARSSGKEYASFSIAVTKGKKDDPNKVTTWFRCLAFNDAAQQALDVVKKGVAIVVRGDLSLKAYIKKDGQSAAVDATVFVHTVDPYEKPVQESADGFDFGK